MEMVMRGLVLGALIAGLAACSSGKDKIAERVEENADNRAQAMEQASQSMTNALAANAAQQQANIVRSAGEERAEAIRNSDLDADVLTDSQKNALVAGKPVGTPTHNPR
jgi:hypothetical protein